jgi:competence protein ComFC
MKQIAKSIGKAFINLLYPPLCKHCQEILQNDSHLLCKECLCLLELIDPLERCPYCFSADVSHEIQVCAPCMKKPPVLNGMAAAFDYAGPAASLVRKMKYTNQPYLAEGCAAYLGAQFLQLEWPMPDVIVPVPIAFTHLLERGYNQSLILSQEFAKIVQRPVQEALVRRSGDYSQAGLEKHQRIKLDGNTIELKKKQQLQDKTILLIDDVMTTGSTMRKCAESLLEDCPKSVYGIAVCRAV